MMIATVRPFYTPAARIIEGLQILIWSPFLFGRSVFTYVIETFYEGCEQNGRRRFQEHYDFIRSIVPKDRLLGYHVSEGWDPLCKFLGDPVPNSEFPTGNRKADLNERVDAYLREEWEKIKGLGLRFAVLGIALRMFLLRRAG
jgi:hypothetical protein